jgi:hypothetical protein
MVTLRRPLNQLATRLFSTLSMTLATSSSRTGAPFLYATISCESGGVFQFDVGLDRGVRVFSVERSGGRVRVGIANRRVNVVNSNAALASAFGSICARTAYFIAPYTCTCDTPSTIEMRCAIRVSAYSSISGNESTSEFKAKKRIGLSDGFDLRMLGGFGMPGGSCGSAAEIAV